MSEAYTINGHLYRAYPFHFFCDGVEIPPAEFYAAVESLSSRSLH
jgi:hypothetical protein